ncbi:DUF1801 domain-containing protein [Kribbella capetownensis]|uniref:DUF1801 domain-containing protein n=1 Tax=Kribbella capetownensis TaxID=1572659 RepID=A0A4R0K1W4_9ACTN|nr:DUF1801 domain-containing protein [Kribbella capetownensis]TCC53941.1 DUF1801 domain-containing protein [Kribbella capetownensis]
MAENKTRRTDASVDDYLAGIAGVRGDDARELTALITEATGLEPAMWGPSIIGFGDRHLVYDSGRELDWFDVGFAARKQALTLYLTTGFDGYDELLARLGPHSTSAGCLYVKRLADVDSGVLAELVRRSAQDTRGRG